MFSAIQSQNKRVKHKELELQERYLRKQERLEQVKGIIQVIKLALRLLYSTVLTIKMSSCEYTHVIYKNINVLCHFSNIRDICRIYSSTQYGFYTTRLFIYCLDPLDPLLTTAMGWGSHCPLLPMVLSLFCHVVIIKYSKNSIVL